MTTITVHRRFGITPTIAAVLRPALVPCSNGERLAAVDPRPRRAVSRAPSETARPASFADAPIWAQFAEDAHRARRHAETATRPWRLRRFGAR